jgi:hypothetical protein
MTRRTENRAMIITTGKAFMGTRPATSLHQRCAAEDAIETNVTSVTSSVLEMHKIGSKVGAEIGSMKRKNSAMEGTMIIMVLTTTNLTEGDHRKHDTSQEVSRHIP